jgi:hypothetical protein
MDWKSRAHASKFRAACGALLLAAFLLPAAAPARIPADAAAGPLDVYGRPVENGKGKINYRRDQTEGLAEALRPPIPAAQKGAATPPGPLAPNDFQLAWHQVDFGVGIGSTGLVFVDWDGSGQPALVAGGGTFGFWQNTYWYLVEQQGGELDTGFASTEYSDYVTALLPVDRDGDGDQELLVAHGKTFEFWDAEGGQPALLASASTTAAEIRGLEYADVDGDGRQEFVFCSGSDLKVQDSVTGAIDHQRLGIGCRDVAVGNVDGDANLEIVVGNGNSAGLIIDGVGFGTQWSNPAGFGSIVRIGDVDGDGAAEIVAAFDWDWLRVYDAVLQIQQLAIPSDHDVDALRLFDTTGDGRPEIVYGDGQWGDLHLLDGISGGQVGLVDNPDHGVTDIAYGDLDHDGQNELLWGAGFSITSEDLLFSYDLGGASLEAVSLDFDGPHYGFAAGDLEGDGEREIVHTVLEQNSGYLGGAIFVRDAASREALQVQRATAFGDFEGRRRVALAQLDGDAALEVILTQDEHLKVFDGATWTQQWSVTTSFSFDLMGLAASDLDADGNLEVVVSTQRVSAGVETQNYIYVFDGATGVLEWQSPSLGSTYLNYAHLRLANVDGDAALEIVVAEDGGELQIWDGASHVRQLLTASLGITALDLADVDGNGAAEVYIGTSAGNLRRLDPATGSVTATYGTYAGGAIQGLEVFDIDGDSHADHIFTVGGKLSVRDGATGTLVWQTARLGSDTARLDSLRAGDFNGNGDLEIWLSLGYVGQMIFERPHTNTPPVVTITTPAADTIEITVGDSLSFAGSALDYEEGDLSADLAWTSSLAGPIGSGASFQTSSLGVGTHLITATAGDAFGEDGQDTVTVHVRTLPVTVTFNSLGAEDGYLLESSENSGVANYLAANQWRIGDGNNDRQYRSLLSFDTSTLPDDAIVKTARVRVRRYNLTNTNPFTTHGACVVDVKAGNFGTSAALELADFESPADAAAAAKMGDPPANLDWSEGLLGAAGRAAVSLKERTQMRLRFELDDNDDNQEDYLNFFGGDNTNVDYRPKLVITYQQ